MKRFLFIALLSICGIWASASAEKDSSVIRIVVQDADTEGAIENGKAEILTKDSVFVCMANWSVNDSFGDKRKSVVIAKVATEGVYLVKLTHPDYVSKYDYCAAVAPIEGVKHYAYEVFSMNKRQKGKSKVQSKKQIRKK